MNKVIILCTILIFTSYNIYSQLLPEGDAKFENIKGYSKVGDNHFGKLVRTTSAITEVFIYQSGINTVITFESTLFSGGMQVFQVRNVNKEVDKGIVIYMTETFNIMDPEMNIVQFIVEYDEGLLKRLILLSTESAAVFY